MEITNNLIRKFFENKCDPAEFEAVMHYLESHPDRLELYGIEDWKATDPQQPVSDHSPMEVLDRLRAELFPDAHHAAGTQESPKLSDRETPKLTDRESTDPTDSSEGPAHRSADASSVRRLAWWAAAASLLVAVCGWLWTASRNDNGKAFASASSGPSANAATRTARATWTSRSNAGGQPKTILMPDGSRVKLYAHSTLRYSDSFGIVRRDSWLEGEAEFTVNKDRIHPFTVYSGALATTALGTSFQVKARTAAGNITVKLFTGKVVVRPAAPIRSWTRDIYLLPGEEMLYDNRSMLAKVSRTRTPGTDSAGRTMDDLVFNNASLKEVFKRLSLHYHTTISYKPSDLAGMNFTGSAGTDSLPNFLRLLATMNNLEVREQSDGFILTRRND